MKGTVISGTHRTQDLIPAFEKALRTVRTTLNSSAHQ